MQRAKNWAGAVQITRIKTLLHHEHFPEWRGEIGTGQNGVDFIARFHFRLRKIDCPFEEKVEFVRNGRFARRSHVESYPIIITKENEEAHHSYGGLRICRKDVIVRIAR